MTTDFDCGFEIDWGQGYVPLQRAHLTNFQKVFQAEIMALLHVLADKFADEFRDIFEKEIRERPRLGNKSLREIILGALTKQVGESRGIVTLGVFNLREAKEKTTGREFGTRNRSLFDIMEEGFEPSSAWGFCERAYALELAQEAIDRGFISQEHATGFLIDVDNAFFGRHGDGIMVNVKAPLFFRIPDFGVPLEYGILPHGGWAGWHALDMFKNMNQDSDWIETIIDAAMKSTAQKVQTI